MLGLSALLGTAATLTLMVALLATDFSLAYVADTTSRATPWPYRLAATWGGMDGSMLFFATLTLGVGWIGAHRMGMGRLGTGAVALVGVGYLLITALVANPFVTMDIPAVDGDGLLGILQHPAMIYHPPILYLGLVGLVVPMAHTLETVVAGRTDSTWIVATRRWLFISWTLLTLGMVAGANWAYVELGWGGFWAWDPVENTALMPWLAISAFLHTSRIQQRDGRLRRLNVFAVLTSFTLTVLGVYLTRSGATGSIHAFAEDPLIGRILLSATLLVLVGSVVVALRGGRATPWADIGWRRDTWLAASAGLLALALVFVAAGSAYPAYLEVFADESAAIGSRFFTTTLYPVALVVAFAIGMALKTRWSRLGVGLRDLLVLSVSGLAVALIVGLTAHNPTGIALTLLACAGGSLVLVVIDMRSRRQLVARLAHAGIAMVLIGAAGSSMGGDHFEVMSPGDRVEVAGHELTMLALTTGEAERFVFAEAEFVLDEEVALTPQIRGYEDQALPIAEPAIHSAPGGDVIVAISLLFPDANAADVSVFVRPLVWWVWGGALTLALAGLVSIVSRGGAGEGRRRRATAAPLPADTTTGMSAR